LSNIPVLTADPITNPVTDPAAIDRRVSVAPMMDWTDA
jgi:hypothetical protein